MLRRLLILAVSLLVILYPLAVYFGLNYWQPKSIGLGLVALMLLRFLAQGKRLHTMSALCLPIFLLGSLVGLGVYFSNNPLLLRLYPFLISLSLLLVFGHSLWQEQTVIERIARLTEPGLPVSGVAYTRQVTLVWCCFFTADGLVALYTAFYTSLEVWTLYNGLISYLLIGLLFATEFSVRSLKRQRGSL